MNGNIVAQGSQFSLNDVEVVTATIDLDDVSSFRTSKSRAMQAARQPSYQRIDVPMRLSIDSENIDPHVGPSPKLTTRYHTPEEEIALGPACWLWDYLRRSRQAGFFLPLSGGIDSCATAVIVHSMCRQVIIAIAQGNSQVLEDCRRICDKPESWKPADAKEIASCLSTQHIWVWRKTRLQTRAPDPEIWLVLSELIMSRSHMDIVVSAITTLFTTVTSFSPRYKMHGGTQAEEFGTAEYPGAAENAAVVPVCPTAAFSTRSKHTWKFAGLG